MERRLALAQFCAAGGDGSETGNLNGWFHSANWQLPLSETTLRLVLFR